MVILILLLLGLCFGSFVNALVWRLQEQQKAKSKKQKAKYSISGGRSMCVHCGHALDVKDLIPVLSWLSLRGKCRYCKKPISWQYPAVELATAALFVLSYLLWPDFQAATLEIGDIGVFGLWLACIVGFIALVVYDLRWMLLPNKIIFPLYGVAAVATVAKMLHTASLQPFLGALYGVLIGGGIFYLLFQISGGKWIGGGDVKLGFLLGAVVGGPASAFLMLFIASVLGSIVSVFLLSIKKASRHSRIPFGPFLISAAIIVQLYGLMIINWYLDFIVGYNV